MNFNILTWCDNIISHLKENEIIFDNGVAILPKESIYTGPIEMLSTYKYRRDIPPNLQKSSLLCFFMPEENLFPRLRSIHDDITEFQKYGGICGFDLSPSIGMLIPRQKLSILINSLYNCYCAIHGIKILPNSRVGDFSTLSMTSSFPNNVGFISGMLGCNKYGFKNYGLYQLCLTISTKNPPVIYIYGGLSKKDATLLFKYSPRNDFKIFVFRDRRNRKRNNAQNYFFSYSDSKDVKKSSLYDIKGGDNHGSKGTIY